MNALMNAVLTVRVLQNCNFSVTMCKLDSCNILNIQINEYWEPCVDCCGLLICHFFILLCVILSLLMFWKFKLMNTKKVVLTVKVLQNLNLFILLSVCLPLVLLLIVKLMNTGKLVLTVEVLQVILFSFYYVYAQLFGQFLRLAPKFSTILERIIEIEILKEKKTWKKTWKKTFL